MIYCTTKNKPDKDSKLTGLDKVILAKCKEGKDIVSLLSKLKPYVDGNGIKTFATTKSVTLAVSKLLGLKLLERR